MNFGHVVNAESWRDVHSGSSWAFGQLLLKEQLHGTLAYLKGQFGAILVGQSERASKHPRPRGARQIYGALKSQIEEGVYKPNEHLPSTRALATEFGASRTTITAAYEQLLAEGYIETRQRRRACVVPELRPDQSSRTHSPKAPRPTRLSAFGRRLTELAGPVAAAEPLQVDFRYGDIAASDFPHVAWRRALTKALTSSSSRSLRYEEPQGSKELRTALQAYLWRARSLRCKVDQIIIVNGSQQALDLCSRILLDGGDRFVIETPCYWAARHAFEGIGATPVYVPVDEDGLQTDALVAHKRARLCYVTPSHQFPLGHVLSASRRHHLLRWAETAGAYVIEDDYDGEYRYDIRPIQPLQTFDEAANVIYLGTFSKTLSPLLRLGYVVVPPELVDVFRAAKRLTDRHSPVLEQAALADFMQSGTYERHVRKLRRKNAQRRAALLDAFSDHFGDTVEVQGSEAGLHVVAWFNNSHARQEDDIARQGRQRGVGIYPISALYGNGREVAAKRRAGFVFGYAALDEREIRIGVARLANTLRTG